MIHVITGSIFLTQIGPIMKKISKIRPRKDMKKIVFVGGLVVAILIANSIIYVAEPIESKIVYTNWILLLSSSLAAGLSVLLTVAILLKQRNLNHHAKIHISLSIGLILWLCANIQWFIYESGWRSPRCSVYR